MPTQRVHGSVLGRAVFRLGRSLLHPTAITANCCQTVMVGWEERPVDPQVRAVRGSGTSIEYLNPTDASECCWLLGVCGQRRPGAGGGWRR